MSESETTGIFISRQGSPRRQDVKEAREAREQESKEGRKQGSKEARRP